MDLEYFIARRLISQNKQKGKKIEPAIRIAIIGIAVGLAVMLIAWAVVMGFRREVRNKIVGVNSNIQITSYFSNFTYEMNPVEISDSFYAELQHVQGVSHIQRLYTKPGMIKTDDAFQTVVMKGMDTDFDATFLRSALVEGRMPNVTNQTNEVILSSNLANMLKLKLGDGFLTYFIRGESISARKFTICGIYNTHFSAFDKYFLVGDARHIRKLNNWNDNQSAGLEIFVDNMKNFPQIEENVYSAVSTAAEKSNETYYMRNMYEMNPELFGWLDLLDTNVWMILFLMIFVSGFNIISGLLILILERTNMIGIMKAMGARNYSLRKVFIYLSLFLISRGILWGNVIGLGLIVLQNYFHLIALNPETYYVDYVPVDINWVYVLMVNLGTILISMLVVLLPTHLIARIQPVKAIRFE